LILYWDGFRTHRTKGDSTGCLSFAILKKDSRILIEDMEPITLLTKSENFHEDFMEVLGYVKEDLETLFIGFISQIFFFLLGIPAFDLNGSGNEAQCILEIVIGDLQGLPEILGNRGVGSANGCGLCDENRSQWVLFRRKDIDELRNPQEIIAKAQEVDAIISNPNATNAQIEEAKREAQMNFYSPILEAPGYNPVLGRGVDGFHHGVLGPPKELFLKIFSKVFKSETLSAVQALEKIDRELNQLNSKRGSQELPEAFVESKILLVRKCSV